MTLEDAHPGEHRQSSQRMALDLLIDAHTHPQRPCPGCQARCPHCGGTQCTCNCGPDCNQVRRALSQDADRYPLEANIVPLVYALNASGVFQPFWSCEGHSNTDRAISRPPQVWFYAASRSISNC